MTLKLRTHKVELYYELQIFVGRIVPPKSDWLSNNTPLTIGLIRKNAFLSINITYNIPLVHRHQVYRLEIRIVLILFFEFPTASPG